MSEQITTRLSSVTFHFTKCDEHYGNDRYFFADSKKFTKEENINKELREVNTILDTRASENTTCALKLSNLCLNAKGLGEGRNNSHLERERHPAQTSLIKPEANQIATFGKEFPFPDDARPRKTNKRVHPKSTRFGNLLKSS